MTVEQLMQRLRELPPHAMVYAFDPDTGDMEPVTGFTIEAGDEGKGLLPMVDLHTDDM